MTRGVRDIHVRLSERAYDTLKELEDISGFKGSRLIEEVVLAASDLMEYLAEFQVSVLSIIEERQLTSEESIATFSALMAALYTILNRLGYEEIVEDHAKSKKKELAKRKKLTATASKENSAQER